MPKGKPMKGEITYYKEYRCNHSRGWAQEKLTDAEIEKYKEELKRVNLYAMYELHNGVRLCAMKAEEFEKRWPEEPT